MNTRALKVLAAAIAVAGGLNLGTPFCFAQSPSPFQSLRVPPLKSIGDLREDNKDRFENRLLAVQAPVQGRHQQPPASAHARILRPTDPTIHKNSDRLTPSPKTGPGRYLVAFAEPVQTNQLNSSFDTPTPPIESASSNADTDLRLAAPPASADASTNAEASNDSLSDLETDSEKASRNSARSPDNLEQSGEAATTPEDASTNDALLDNTGTETADPIDASGDLDDGDDVEDPDSETPVRRIRVFGTWPKKSMREVNTDVRPSSAAVPKDQSSVLSNSSQRFYNGQANSEKVFAWAAPNIRHQPLYFEDASLERYGQTKGIIKQPFASAFEFLRDSALLPLNASIDCPYSCDTPLGFARPGSQGTECGCQQCQRR